MLSPLVLRGFPKRAGYSGKRNTHFSSTPLASRPDFAEIYRPARVKLIHFRMSDDEFRDSDELDEDDDFSDEDDESSDDDFNEEDEEDAM